MIHFIDGGGLVGVGVPNENRFRQCISAMQCKFQSRACISARSFLLEGRSGFLALVANGTTNPPKPKLPRPVSPWGDHVIPFRATLVGRRICASFGTTRVFQSQSRVSTWFPFISRGEFMFLFRREQSLRTTGFRPTVSDATCCSFGDHASPEDARMGRRIDEFRLVFVLIPVARSDHCSYRCGYTTFVLPS